MVSPDQQINCNGILTEWRYQGQTSNPFRALIWRPIHFGSTSYRIVGVNDIPAGAVNIPISYTVPEDERIQVQTGDMIGWSHESAVLTYNQGGAHRVRWFSENVYSSLAQGQLFNIYHGEARQYSIQAIIEEGK